MDALRKRIKEIVDGSQGIKGTDLVVEVMTAIPIIQAAFDSDNVIEVTRDMVSLNEIHDIEYELPNGTRKNFYFPAGSKLLSYSWETEPELKRESL